MKTKHSGVSAVNRQIFSLDDAAKKLYQLIVFFLLSFICSSVHASSISGDSHTLKTSTTSTTTPNLASSVEDYGNLSTYPGSLVSTSLSWTMQGGAVGGSATGYGISTDSSGNSYVTGITSIGLFGQPQNGGEDYFIAKYDVVGKLIWIRQVGTYGGGTEGSAISTDSSGNSYVTGWTNKGISGQVQNGANDYFIAKYNTNGDLIWTRQVGAKGGYTWGYGISADNFGNIYVTGGTDVGISGQKQHGYNDYFIAKYDANGNLIWTKQVGASGGDIYGNGISADNSGNAYVTGYTNRGISGQKQNGLNDYFIAKYNANGNLLWSRQVGVYEGNTEGFGISVNNSGNIYVAGSTNIGISGQAQNGEWDYFIAAYDTSGNLIWTKQVGTYCGSSCGYTYGNGISANNSGSIYVTGYTSVGISGQKQTGWHDYFIAKYDQDGSLESTSQVGAHVESNDGKIYYGDTKGNGISADNLGNVYVTGTTNMGISGQPQNDGGYDYFIAKYVN